MGIRGSPGLVIAIAAVLGLGAQPLQAKWSWDSLNPFRPADAKSAAAIKPKTKAAATSAKSSARRSATSAGKKSKKSSSWIDKTTDALKFRKSSKAKKPTTAPLARASGKAPFKKTKDSNRSTSWFGSWFGASDHSETKTVPGWTPAKGDKESR